MNAFKSNLSTVLNALGFAVFIAGVIYALNRAVHFPGLHFEHGLYPVFWWAMVVGLLWVGGRLFRLVPADEPAAPRHFYDEIYDERWIETEPGRTLEPRENFAMTRSGIPHGSHWSSRWQPHVVFELVMVENGKVYLVAAAAEPDIAKPPGRLVVNAEHFLKNFVMMERREVVA